LGIPGKISNFGIYLLAGSRLQAFRLQPTRALRAKTAIAKNGLNGTTLCFSGSSPKPVQSIWPKDGKFMLKAGCGRENLSAKNGGGKRQRAEIVAHQVQFFGPRPEAPAGGEAEEPAASEEVPF
jgi:hypothetical protein